MSKRSWLNLFSRSLSHKAGRTIFARESDKRKSIRPDLELLEERAVPATVSINDVTVTEGNSGTTNADFTVTLSEALDQTVTVTYQTSDGTATVADTDYQLASGTVVFDPGQTSKTITVLVNGDTKFETDETFAVLLTQVHVTSETGTITFTSTGSATEEGFNSTPGQVISNPFFAEGDYRVEAFRIDPNNQPAEHIAHFHVADIDTDLTDNAEQNHNQRGPSAGNTEVQGVRITRLDGRPFNLSQMHLENEVAVGNFSDPTTGAGTFTLFQNHNPADAGAAIFSFGNSFTNVTSIVLADPGIAGSNLPTNVTSTWDNIVLVRAPTVTLADAEGLGTITNDDNPPTVSINDVSVVEGDSGQVDLVFTVSLSNPSDLVAAVDFASADGSATTGNNDYDPVSGTVTFSPGTTTQTVTVKVNGDLDDEGDENFFVNLSNPSGTTIEDGSGTGTILNDDAPPDITINDVTLNEGNSGTTSFDFVVSLSAPAKRPVTVQYATQDGSATIADGDYAAGSGTLTFGVGEDSKTVTVLVNGDTKFETNETFEVKLSNPTDSTIVDDTGAGTILNDDSQPSISIDDVSLTEGNSGTKTATFTVSLSNESTETVTVKFATQDGTATTGDNDYAAASGTLTFAPGVTSQTVSVTINGDTKFETNETFEVILSDPVNGTIQDGTGQGTIENDDSRPTISIDDVSVTEGNSGTTTAAFTVTLSNPSAETITVEFTAADGSATTADSDYDFITGTLTFAPGQTSQTISVVVNGDERFEPNENFFVHLSSAVNATIVDGQGEGTILNDDQDDGSCFNHDDALVIEGTAGNDKIFIKKSHHGKVKVYINGRFQGKFDPKERIIIRGLEGNDFIHVANSVRVDTWIFGGAGNDKMFGGKGNDIIVGGAGNDFALGRHGRDILIGGTGRDKLIGNSGDDILVAGTTDFDDNLEALCHIQAEWTSDRSFKTRVKNLTNGSGSSNAANGNFFLTAATVHDDGARDKLVGACGRDWYFANCDPNVGVLDIIAGFQRGRDKFTQTY